MMEFRQDLPITRVCIISDPCKCPANYTVITRTYESTEDADLWKDKNFFSKKNMRYLCVEKQIPLQTQDVLVDVSIINEKDNVPPGFHVLEITQDTKEKASPKRFICVRWMSPSLTNDAITDLIFQSKSQSKKPPQGYTAVGEISNMQLCYKMGRLPQNNFQMTSAAPLYSLPPSDQSGLPYASSPAVTVKSVLAGHSTLTRTGPPEQSANSLATSHVNPISGIEWKLNQKYTLLLELQKMTIPDIPNKSVQDIDCQYHYDFRAENSVSRQHQHDLHHFST